MKAWKTIKNAWLTYLGRGTKEMFVDKLEGKIRDMSIIGYEAVKRIYLCDKYWAPQDYLSSHSQPLNEDWLLCMQQGTENLFSAKCMVVLVVFEANQEKLQTTLTTLLNAWLG